MFLILAPEVNKAAVGTNKLTGIHRDELEPTKTDGNLSQRLADSNLDHGMTSRKSWHRPSRSYSTPGLAAREANGGAPEGAEGSVGLTAANNSKVSQQINNMHKL